MVRVDRSGGKVEGAAAVEDLAAGRKDDIFVAFDGWEAQIQAS